jgi:hypothetical protein
MVSLGSSLNLNLLFFTSLQLQLHFSNISSTDLYVILTSFLQQFLFFPFPSNSYIFWQQQTIAFS